MPARARPVPFCRHGFLFDLLTSPRVVLRARALPRIGEIGGDDLVHQRLVVVAAERGVGRGHRCGRLALLVDELEFHVAAAASFPYRLGAGFAAGAPSDCGRASHAPSAHRDVAAARAGHRAADQQQLALGIDAHDLEVLHGALPAPRWPGHALAGEHAARVLVLADRARLVVRNRVAVARAVGGEMVALDDAGEALAAATCRRHRPSGRP